VTTLEFGSQSDIGLARSDNQDCYGKFPENDLELSGPLGQLFVVADGMGGHRGGREASHLAVTTVGAEYFSGTGGIDDRLRRAFEKANERIYLGSMENPKLYGMGTTCSTLVLQDARAVIAHIGDSRIYRIMRKEIVQVTSDHSTVAEMERRGIITREEAKFHPERSTLYRAMGTKPDIEIDIIDGITIGDDEYFMMCSDGLSNMVDTDEMQKIVLSHPPQEACERLVDLANERGGLDNITVLVIHVTAKEQPFN
jgi:protein phosphatase